MRRIGGAGSLAAGIGFPFGLSATEIALIAVAIVLAVVVAIVAALSAKQRGRR